ncbi:hypothetical protein IV417_14365 [Alphaproteobacteria bacterium KMM 3653]|uniref:Glycosyltransferase family 92 protein n=1 Tax=Harenicola maris TaxID=2841044 RepID=A0AAP2G4R3_9RHOB|nr:hypothetical protein [Harenicola maris]
MDSSIVTLSPAIFEPDGPVRGLPPVQRRLGADVPPNYDQSTFIYHAFWKAGRIEAICPKLYDFEGLLPQMRFASDHGPLPAPRLRRHRRHDVLRFACPEPPGVLHLYHEALDLRIEVAEAGQLPGFAGRNAMAALNKDNPLEWIADWAQFHVRQQGLQSLLLFDNGSQTYAPEDIIAALERTGLAQASVVRLPFAYGPIFPKKPSHVGKFLQSAALNIASGDFLSGARAVLLADIDELVWTKGGSIFDKAVNSRLGYCRIPGDWRGVHPGATQDPARHKDHIFPITGGSAVPTKYCVVPGGRLGWAQWDVHALRGVPRLSLHLKPKADMGFWHCRRINTGWKIKGGRAEAPIGPKDDFTAAQMTAVYDGAPPVEASAPEGGAA